MHYYNFLFDFDYTLFDSSRGIVKCFNESFKEMGLPICNEKIIKKTIGYSLEDAFCSLQNNIKSNDYERFHMLFLNNSTQFMVDNTAIYDGVYELFQLLNSYHYKIGIVTSKDVVTVSKILKKYECYHFVDAIIGEESVLHKKPHGEPLCKAIEVLNASTLDTVYIGDCIVDARAALNANIDFIAVLTGTTDANAFCKYGILKSSIFSSIYDYYLYLIQKL